jgi:putative tricarboxylic transport membrane protein
VVRAPTGLFGKDVMTLKNAGVWVGICILVFAGTIFWQSLSYDYYGDYGPGPGLFPLWLSGTLIVLTLLYIGESLKKEIILLTDILPKGKSLWNVLSIIASLIIFLFLVPYTGYTIAGIVMLFILFLREYKWYWGLGISAVVTLIVFFAFHSLLNIPLPVSSFGL